ncbi:MAG: respiratory chain complex I subunit 1 family protein [Gammaproteobacteria bacterium]
MNTGVWLLALLQLLLFLVAAPLLTGWVKWLKARLQNRRGPAPWQTWRTLYKLLGKEVLVAYTSSALFRVAPYIVFAATLLACAALPLLAVHIPTAALADVIVLVGLLALARFFLALAAMDVGTAFGGMGASREMLISALAEPALLLVVFTLAMTAHSTNLAAMVDYQLDTGLLLRPSYLFALMGLLLLAVAESGRIPVDNPATHLELTMVHEAMILEYSGRHLALMEWAAQLKLMLYGVLIVNVFFPWGIATDFTVAALLGGLAALTFKLLLLGALLSLMETGLAKMRLFRVPQFLNFALLLALLGMLSHVMLEVAP